MRLRSAGGLRDLLHLFSSSHGVGAICGIGHLHGMRLSTPWLQRSCSRRTTPWPYRRGNPVVQIALSRRDVIRDAAHDWLWIVGRGELDVPRLVKVKVGG